MVKLPPYTWKKITVEFFIDYKPTLQKIKDLLKLSLKIIVSIPGILSKKPTLIRFFKRAYKIKAMIVFLSLAMLVLQYLSLNLIWDQFLSKKYYFNKDNLYVKNISWLISLLPKIESIFSIITILTKIQYKFENGTVLKVSKKLIIVAINPLVYYLIIIVSFIGLLLITKLMFISIEFKITRDRNYTYNDLIKLEKEIRPS